MCRPDDYPPYEAYINVIEVAAWLNIHVNTAKRIPPSELPYFRVTSRGDRRYLPSDVEGYIRKRTES